LARELEALQTGRRLGMHDLDWESLLGLAHHYGWRPSEGSEHYLLLLKGRGIVSPSEARALAGALEEALLDLPAERRRWLRPTVGALGGFIDERSRPAGRGTDYERYFWWGRRWIVEEVARLCRQGAVEIRPIRGGETS
jgi:hypothetical protein